MLIAVPDALRHAGEQALEQLLERLSGLSAAVIATTDGFEVAARARAGVEVAKLAAMASSISALGAMAGLESDVGDYRNVIVEATEGYILIVDIPHPSYPMILNLVARREQMLGEVIYLAKRMAAQLSAVTSPLTTEPAAGAAAVSP